MSDAIKTQLPLEQPCIMSCIDSDARFTFSGCGFYRVLTAFLLAGCNRLGVVRARVEQNETSHSKYIIQQHYTDC